MSCLLIMTSLLLTPMKSSTSVKHPKQNSGDSKKSRCLWSKCNSEKECLEGAWKAVACNCDFLMGTTFFDSVNDFCRENHLNYLPFVGKITGRPSVLEGTLEEMINEANAYIAKGVYGIDLLGYRYTGDAALLNREFVKNMEVPVCIAGSVNSYERLQEIKAVSPWAFTIGGAFFENKFDGTMKEQIDKVCNFMKE